MKPMEYKARRDELNAELTRLYVEFYTPYILEFEELERKSPKGIMVTKFCRERGISQSSFSQALAKRQAAKDARASFLLSNDWRAAEEFGTVKILKSVGCNRAAA